MASETTGTPDTIEMTECPCCHGLFKEVFGETLCRPCASAIAEQAPMLKMFPTVAMSQLRRQPRMNVVEPLIKHRDTFEAAHDPDNTVGCFPDRFHEQTKF